MQKKFLCFGIILLSLFSSCKKDEFKALDLAAFNVINVVGDLSVKSDFTGKPGVFATTETQTDFGRITRFVAPVNQVVPVTVVSSVDLENVLFKRSLTFAPGDIYSLFLAGEVENVDTILIKETVPVRPENTMGIRFINCSPSGALKIVPIQDDYSGGHTPQPAIATLGYKERTEFIFYPSSDLVSSYTIEFRDPLTDNLLASTFVATTNPNTTVVIRGFIDGSPALGAIKMAFHR